MQVKGIACPFCGAPISIPEGSSKQVCPYCRKESVIEAKIVENFEKNISAKFDKVESQNQVLLGKVENLQNLLQNPNPLTSSVQAESIFPETISHCSYSTTLFLAIFTGILGGHRYYTGKIGSALIQTFTFGGFYIWWIIDIIMILSGNFTDAKGKTLNKEKKVNPALVKVVLWIVIAFAIMVVLVGFTGSDMSYPVKYLVCFGPLALSAILVNINRIYAFWLKQSQKGRAQ